MLPGPMLEVATVIAPHARARLDAAVGRDCRAYHVASVGEALRCVRERPVRALLVSPQMVGGEQLSDLARIARGFPSVSTMAVMVSHDDSRLPQRLVELGAHGVRGVIDLASRDGWQQLRAVVSAPASAVGARLLQRLLPALDPETTVETRRLFEYLVRVAPGVTTVRHLCRLLGAVPSTFMSRFFRAGLPSPKRYLSGIRLIYAAALLHEPGRNIADVAYVLEFSSPQSFGRHVRAALGLCATEFRRQYSFERAAREFVDSLIVPYRPTFNSFRPFNAGTVDPGHTS